MLTDIVNKGSSVTTRNSTTKRIPNLMHTFHATPLITVRRTAWKSALREMEWFLSGSNNVNDLHPSVRKWWEPWINSTCDVDNGEAFVNNNYSKQFRRFEGHGHGPVKTFHSVDQLQVLKDGIKNHPYSRRNVITTWHTHDMVSPATDITNCHGSLIQALVEPSDNSLHLTMVQRSADMALGVPHNWIQYWAFLMYLAHHGGREVGSFCWHGVDCHVYPDHEAMIKRMANSLHKALKVPELVYTPTSEDFIASDFTLNSKYEPVIKESLEMTV